MQTSLAPVEDPVKFRGTARVAPLTAFPNYSLGSRPRFLAQPSEHDAESVDDKKLRQAVFPCPLIR